MLLVFFGVIHTGCFVQYRALSSLPSEMHCLVRTMATQNLQRSTWMNVAKIWIYSDIGALQHPFSSLGTDSCNKRLQQFHGEPCPNRQLPCLYTPKSVPSSYDRRRDAHFEKDGGDLLSRLRSTIGAAGLNFSVRNGKRWNTNAIATRMGDMYGQLLFLSRAARPHAGRAQAYCDF